MPSARKTSRKNPCVSENPRPLPLYPAPGLSHDARLPQNHTLAAATRHRITDPLVNRNAHRRLQLIDDVKRLMTGLVKIPTQKTDYHRRRHTQARVQMRSFLFSLGSDVFVCPSTFPRPLSASAIPCFEPEPASFAKARCKAPGPCRARLAPDIRRPMPGSRPALVPSGHIHARKQVSARSSSPASMHPNAAIRFAPGSSGLISKALAKYPLDFSSDPS